MPPCPRPACSATRWRTSPSSSPLHRSRLRQSGTSCPGVQLLPPPGRRRQCLGLLVAEGGPLPPPPLPRSRRSSLQPSSAVEPPAGQPSRPSRPPPNQAASVGASGPETDDPGMEMFGLREMVNAPLPPPEEGRAENLLFPFLPLASRSVVPKTSAKEQFPLSLGPQRGRGVVNESNLSYTHPPLSPVGSCGRFERAVNRTTHAPSARTQVSASHTPTPLRTGNETLEPGPCVPPRCPTAGTSVGSLVSLVRFWGAWLALPNPSRWLLRTIRLGYAIQFARRPPKYRGIHSTTVRAGDAPILRAEIAVLLAKDAIEPVPPADMRSGFYSPYFIVPKKSGGLRPILDLRVLNRALHRLPFKMLTPKRILRPSPRLVCSDRPEGRVLPRVDPSAPQAIPSLRSPERTGRAHSQLPRRLAYTSSVAGPVMRTQGHGALAPQPVGPSGQLGKEQTLPGAEDLFSRYGVGLGQSDSAPHAGTRSVGVELLEYIQEQDGGTTETVSEAPGAYGGCGGGHAAGAAPYETASTLAPWPSPEVGVAERHAEGPSHSSLPPNLHPVVRPFIPSGRSAPGTGLQARCGLHRRLRQGLGGHVQRACSVRGLDGSPNALAHQLPRVAGSTPGLEPSQETLTRRACTSPYGQHGDRCVHQPTRWSTLPSHVTTRPPPPPLESEASEVASRHSYPGLAQPDSRRAVTSCAPRRMETPSPDGPADLATFWTRTGRPVRVPRDVALPVVLLPDRWNTRHGRTGTQLAAGPSQICISPSEPSRTDSVQGQRGRGADPARGTILAYQDLVPRADAPRDSPSLADSSEEGSTDSETGHLMAPASRPLETSCLVPRRDAEVLGDLPQEVVDTITSARAPSMRHAYALKWNLFVEWCSSHREDPRRCPIRVVLSFLQQGLERRLSPSTLKVYVAAIAANHDPVEGKSVGKHDWVVRFLRGARRLNPPRPPSIPSWDLSLVLRALQQGPFEPLQTVEPKFLSMKTLLLLALASIKRVGDLHAFSVDDSCLQFGPADSQIILRPRPGYVPKVPTTPFRDQVVSLQALPPEEADPALALLCPVRALRHYVDRTQSFRTSDQLFVCHGGRQKGNAVSKQRMAHWIVDAITLAYQAQGVPCPFRLRAHSTRSVASSWALARGASLTDICRAAGWATPNTFARFYSLRVEPVSSCVLTSNG